MWFRILKQLMKIPFALQISRAHSISRIETFSKLQLLRGLLHKVLRYSRQVHEIKTCSNRLPTHGYDSKWWISLQTSSLKLEPCYLDTREVIGRCLESFLFTFLQPLENSRSQPVLYSYTSSLSSQNVILIWSEITRLSNQIHLRRSYGGRKIFHWGVTMTPTT